jgi:hypothetical protein
MYRRLADGFAAMKKKRRDIMVSSRTRSRQPAQTWQRQRKLQKNKPGSQRCACPADDG